MSNFPGAVHGSHVGPKVLGKLDRKRTYRSTRTIDQNLLSALDISLSEKTQCFKSPNRNGGGFLVGHIGRFYCQRPFFRFFRQTYVLGIGTHNSKTGSCKNLSPFLNRFTSLPTDSISPANSIPSMVILSGLLRPTYARMGSAYQIGKLRLRCSQSPAVTVVAYILISTSLSLGVGFSTSCELKNIRRSVFCPYNRFHNWPLCSTVMTTFPFLCPFSTYL